MISRYNSPAINLKKKLEKASDPTISENISVSDMTSILEKS
jgi:hypothetical protein